MNVPYWAVGAADVRQAIVDIRSRLRGLDKPRWWRAALALGRLRQTQRITEWPDVEWEMPPGSHPERHTYVSAIADVLGGSAARVCALNRAAGAALHQALGQPARVVVDVGADPERANEVQVAAATGRSTTDVGVWVALNDPALAWTGGAGQAGNYVAREYNPTNEFGQQQGLRSAYPLLDLRALGRQEADDLIGQDRRGCGYLVLKQHSNGGWQPTCSINGAGCSYKSPVPAGREAWGTGGPKVLLERRDRRPTGVSAPRAATTPPLMVQDVAKRDNPNGFVLSPGWPEHLRRAMGPQGGAPPTVADVAALIGWLHPDPDGAFARPRTLADLIGEDVMLAICC